MDAALQYKSLCRRCGTISAIPIRCSACGGPAVFTARGTGREAAVTPEVAPPGELVPVVGVAAIGLRQRFGFAAAVLATSALMGGLAGGLW